MTSRPLSRCVLKLHGINRERRNKRRAKTDASVTRGGIASVMVPAAGSSAAGPECQDRQARGGASLAAYSETASGVRASSSAAISSSDRTRPR